MKLHIYAKLTDDLSYFETVIDKFEWEEIHITRENTYSYEYFEAMIELITEQDVVLLRDVSSLGKDIVDIINHLHWFIENSRLLVIVDRPSTYEYGIQQPMNLALLQMLEQTLLSENQSYVEVNKNRHTNAGRKRADYPSNWQRLYMEWKENKITSSEFINQSGLKRATFYNLLSDYQLLEKQESEFVKKYNIS